MSDPRDFREAFEHHHESWLADCAVSEADFGGRKVAEQPHSYRSCFQRDRDRIVHCSAFRRLDFKTQVFVPHENDHFRTRLTHTMEVALVGRSLGRALRLNEDLIEAVALAHDLGHPPFGHCGESALDALMADFGHFEHNRQSLRVVDYLEHPYPQFRGLNLTRAVRECIARHKTRYDSPVCEDFDQSLQGPLEGQMVDLADEIAFTSADLEDSLAAGWIDVAALGELELWRRAWQFTGLACPEASDIHKRIRACKAVMGMMADDAIATTKANMEALDVRSVDDVRQAGRRCAEFSVDIAKAVAQLQDFLFNNVYVHPRAKVLADESRGIIVDLFGVFTAYSGLLPSRYSKRIEAEGLQRVVCDYIAGMTDRYCRQEHERLIGRPG